MRSGPLSLCLLVLTCVQVHVAWLRLAGPPAFGPPHARRSAFAMERVGQGLACTSEPALASVRMCRHGPCGALSTERRLLVGAALDPARMSVRDWEALPDVGPARARALHAAFAAGPNAWQAVPGLGRRLMSTLARMLDAERASDICSLGSWPTTSSGYDRQR